MTIKIIFPLFLTLVIGIFPLRVAGMEGGDDDESSEYSSHGESTLQNTDTEREQAAKASGVRASAEAGSGVIDDDDSGQGEVSAGGNSIGTAIDDSSNIATSQKKAASRASSKKEKASSVVNRGGLSNEEQTSCWINSSLQLAKSFKDQLDLAELARMPLFSRFLNERLSNNPTTFDEECRALRQEMATQVIEGNDRVLRNAIQNGVPQRQEDVQEFLELLLDKTRAPELLFEEQLENSTTGVIRTKAMPLGKILPIAVPENHGGSVVMQDLINGRLTSTYEQRWVDEDITSPVVDVRSQLRLRDDAIPPTLVVSLGRFGFDGHGVKNQIMISGFTNRITLPSANGEQITYEPTAIICHIGDTIEQGHYITHRKENGQWTTFDDQRVEPASTAELADASQNCYVISYRKVDDREPNTQFIFSRRYLKIDPDEFKEIAGPARGVRSQQMNTLMKNLDEYKKLPHDEESHSEKANRLEDLKFLTNKYLKTKEDDLKLEMGKASFSSDEIERSLRRIDACNLLLRGIELESFELEGKVMARLDPERGFIPRRGIRVRAEKILEYQSKFASGVMSSVDRFRLIDDPNKEFVFKEEHPLVELDARHALQLGFLEGTTKKHANLAGRSLATYKIDKLLGSNLVPPIGLMSLGAEGSERNGHFQEIAEGDHLYKQEPIKISKEELRAKIGSESDVDAYLAHVALGNNCPYDVKLHFPDFLVQASPNKPLLENGKPIPEARAHDLVEEGAFYFEREGMMSLSSVSQRINFKDPHLQQTLANAQLLHFITGELDPNPLNFIYVRDSRGGQRVAVIDADLSFPDDFIFPDSLREAEDPLDIDRALQAIIERKHVPHVRGLPTLIDEAMGEAILAVRAPEIDKALQGTGLTQAEINAAKNRLVTLQHYIERRRDTRGYATWGDETYETAKADPEHSYLGYFLEARELQKEAYQRQLLEQIELLERPAVLSQAEEEELQRARQKLELIQKIEQLEKKANLIHAEKEELEKAKNELEQLQNLRTFLKEGPREEATDQPLEDEARSEVRSQISTISRRTTTTLNSFFAAGSSLRKHRYNPIQASRASWVPGLPTVFSSGPRDVHTSTLLFNANKAWIMADKKEGLAQQALMTAQEKTAPKEKEEKLSLAAPLEEIHSLWREAVQKLIQAEESWSAAIKAYEEERDASPSTFSSVRENYLAIAKEKKENTVPHILWAQVHRAESAASLAWNEAIRTSDQADWEKATNKLAQTQQAWRVLLSNIVAPLTGPLKIWRDNLEIAKSAQGYTPFFSDWAKVADKCFNAAIAEDLQESQGHIMQAMGYLRKLAHQTKTKIPIREHQERLLQEINAQEAYAHAQEKMISVDWYKNGISTMAVETPPMIRTSAKVNWMEDDPWIQNVYISGVDEEKLKILCSNWNKLLTLTASEEQLLPAAIKLLEQLPAINPHRLKHEKIVQLSDRLPVLCIDQAERLIHLGKLAFESMLTAPSLLSDQLLEEATAKISQAKELCDKAASKFGKDKVSIWRPEFPSVSVVTGSYEYTIDGCGDIPAADVTYYNYAKLVPMRLFLHNIHNYPNCLPFKASLEEMIHGKPDPIKERWDAVSKEIDKISPQITEYVNQNFPVRPNTEIASLTDRLKTLTPLANEGKTALLLLEKYFQQKMEEARQEANEIKSPWIASSRRLKRAADQFVLQARNNVARINSLKTNWSRLTSAERNSELDQIRATEKERLSTFLSAKMNPAELTQQAQSLRRKIVDKKIFEDAAEALEEATRLQDEKNPELALIRRNLASQYQYDAMLMDYDEAQSYYDRITLSLDSYGLVPFLRTRKYPGGMRRSDRRIFTVDRNPSRTELIRRSLFPTTSRSLSQQRADGHFESCKDILSLAAKVLEKENATTREVITVWNDLTGVYYALADCCNRGAQEFQRNYLNNEELNAVAYSHLYLRSVVDALEKAMSHESERSAAIVSRRRNIVALYQQSLTSFIQAARAYATGNSSEGNRLTAEAKASFNEAIRLIELANAIEAVAPTTAKK